MIRAIDFEIRLGQRYASQDSERPEILPEEYSDLELDLQSFCFEQNRDVFIRIGQKEIVVQLFPDIDLILAHLPQDIAELSHGNQTELPFDEVGMVVTFHPKNNEVVCTLREFGKQVRCTELRLDRAQVLVVLRDFVNELARLALDNDYITPDQKEAFLGVIRKKDIGHP